MSDSIVFVAFQTDSHANGGLESLTHILRELECRRVVITQIEGPFASKWRALGCDVRILPVSDPRPLQGVSLAAYRLRRVPEILKTNADAIRIVRETGARVVHCNDPGAFWYAGLGPAACGARVVLNIRDTRPNRSYGIRWRLLRHFADTMVVLSDEMRAELSEELTPVVPLRQADIAYIHSAVDLSRMRRADAPERGLLRRRLAIPESEFVIAYVGTFNEKKNQLTFLERGAPRLLEEANSKLYFIGDFRPDIDLYAEKCRAAVDASHLTEKVRFVGYTPHPEDWYRAADVICLASRNEGLARAMIEGLSCGTPVVSFDVSSAREVLEGYRCGVVAKQGDYAGLVEALEGLRSDSARRLEYGARGEAAAKDLFDPARSVSKYRRLYQQLSGTTEVRE